MAIQKVNIQQAFYDVLIERDFDNFTALQLRDAVGATSLEKRKVIELRKLVYRTLNRLINKGLIVKDHACEGKKPVYLKAESFDTANWHILDHITNDTPQSISEGTTEWLNERLEQCESDFIACLSEFETYKDLCKQAPHLNAKLQDVRSKAREQSSRLLGEIRALKIAMSIS